MKLNEELEAILKRQLEQMRETHERVADPDGQIPAGMKAESDQFYAESRGLLDIFVLHAREHQEKRAEQGCCAIDRNCVGPEVMLSISVASEAIRAHLLGAMTVAVGKLAALPPEGEVDPRERR